MEDKYRGRVEGGRRPWGRREGQGKQREGK